MQKVDFHDGSFCCHKVILAGRKGHFSFWANKGGQIKCAEQITVNKQCRAVSAATIELLQKVADVFTPIAKF